jgi:hypothetical protein
MKHVYAGLVLDFLAALHADIANNVTGIVGLKEAADSKHPLVKFIWSILFIAGLVATGFFTYRTAQEYLAEPSATKVSCVKNI